MRVIVILRDKHTHLQPTNARLGIFDGGAELAQPVGDAVDVAGAVLLEITIDAVLRSNDIKVIVEWHGW